MKALRNTWVPMLNTPMKEDDQHAYATVPTDENAADQKDGNDNAVEVTEDKNEPVDGEL